MQSVSCEYVSLSLKHNRNTLQSTLNNLLTYPGCIERYANNFKRRVQHQAPDTGPDVDTVDIGLIYMEEVWYVFPKQVLASWYSPAFDACQFVTSP